MTDLQFLFLSFDQLSTHQLHDVLQLRSAIFVVEQDCVYQDVDGKDKEASHLLAYLGDQLVGYARLFAPGIYFDHAAIGRVVLSLAYRRGGYGTALMQECMRIVGQHQWPVVEISAQEHLIDFYNRVGFTTKGTVYLEDGIPHVRMIYRD